MRRQAITFSMSIVLLAVSGLIAAVAFQEREPKKVMRVKRPIFTRQDWDGIYFEDLFKQGLVGKRPDKAKRQTPPPAIAGAGQNATSGNKAGDFAWSKFISGTTIEDEVKSLQQSLLRDVTTPGKFKSNYAKARQSLSMLSMLFAIVRQYDDDVRWKKDASNAQVSFQRAAANARVGSIQAYENCKRRRDDLQELVRGGNFPAGDKPPEQLDWPAVVDRTPIMKRLQISQDILKELTASKGSFEKDVAKTLHESQLVAAMAQTILKENMTDAEDEGYREFARSMSDAAVAIGQSCQTNDYEAAANAVNLLGQSCSDCHDQWR